MLKDIAFEGDGEGRGAEHKFAVVPIYLNEVEPL